MKFFVRSYLRRTGQKGGKGVGRVTLHGAGEKSVQDAFKAIDREVYQHEDGFTSGNANGHANGHVKAN